MVENVKRGHFHIIMYFLMCVYHIFIIYSVETKLKSHDFMYLDNRIGITHRLLIAP